MKDTSVHFALIVNLRICRAAVTLLSVQNLHLSPNPGLVLQLVFSWTYIFLESKVRMLCNLITKIEKILIDYNFN